MPWPPDPPPPTDSKRVLLTGASGFIGSNVLAYLAERHDDWQFVCIQSWQHKGNALRTYPIYERYHDRIEMVTLDLSAPIPNVFGSFDYILNLASESHVDRSIANPRSFIENNVSLAVNVMEFARHVQPELVIQFSTDEVFGEGGGIRRPLDRLRPSSPYAASKACQEMIATSYARTYDVPVIITNTSNVIGPGQDSEKFPAKAWELIRCGGEVDIHVDDQNRQGARIYNPIPNVCSALNFLLDDAQIHPPSTRILIPGGSRRTNLELAETIAKAMGEPLRFRFVKVEGLRPGYDSEYAYLDGYLLSAMGWRPVVDLDLYLDTLLHPNNPVDAYAEPVRLPGTNGNWGQG